MSALYNTDPEIASALQKELERQQNQIELIASENIVSEAVLEAQGSIFANKYAEGYPGRRYYGGCEFMDIAESLAIERVKKLFNCQFANVQSHSGAQANQAVMLAFLQPGDAFMGLNLAAGGHLTHGSPVNLSGKWFRCISYGVDPVHHLIDYDQVEQLSHQHKPKLIMAGGSVYPRIIDFARLRDIADSINTLLMVDMAHFAGLVAGGVYPDPFPFAHIVTSTTHKTLRGPRGGIILTNNKDLAKKINSAVFPGLQGGPLMHTIAAKAVAFKEALEPSFKRYAQNVLQNAQTLAYRLKELGYSIVSGGTDSHVVLVDLTPQRLTGKEASHVLESVRLTCNKNGIPFDPLPPTVASGIRLGSPAATTRGLTKEKFQRIAELIEETLQAHKNGKNLDSIKEEVYQICKKYPIYPALKYEL